MWVFFHYLVRSFVDILTSYVVPVLTDFTLQWIIPITDCLFALRAGLDAHWVIGVPSVHWGLCWVTFFASWHVSVWRFHHKWTKLTSSASDYSKSFSNTCSRSGFVTPNVKQCKRFRGLSALAQLSDLDNTHKKDTLHPWADSGHKNPGIRPN